MNRSSTIRAGSNVNSPKFNGAVFFFNELVPFYFISFTHTHKDDVIHIPSNSVTLSPDRQTEQQHINKCSDASAKAGKKHAGNVKSARFEILRKSALITL